MNKVFALLHVVTHETLHHWVLEIHHFEPKLREYCQHLNLGLIAKLIVDIHK